MPLTTPAGKPGDRAGDRRTASAGLRKPPILRRCTQRISCGVVLAVVVYGTLGPLGSHPGPWLQMPPSWQWVPLQRPSDANDIITNFFVYLPVGVALRLLVRRRGSAGWPDFVVALNAALLLSYVTEVLQQAMPARSANLTDILVNGVGALVGCLSAPRLQALVRKLHALTFLQVHLRRGGWSVMTWLAVIVAFLLMTMPWNLSRPAHILSGDWSHDSLPLDLRRPTSWLGIDKPLAVGDPLWLGRCAAFGGVGFLASGWLLTRGRSRRRAVWGTVWRVAAFAVSLEVAQAFLSEHVSSLLHAVVATTAALIGAWIAVRLLASQARVTARPPGRLTPTVTTHLPDGRRTAPVPGIVMRRFGVFILVGCVALIFAKGVVTGLVNNGLRTEPVYEWIPFQGHFEASFQRMVTDLVQQGVLFGSLTLLCLYLTQGRAKLATLLLLLGVVGTVEICQAFVKGHGADTTSPLLVLMVWFATTRIWHSIFPAQPARPPGCVTVADTPGRLRPVAQ